MRPRAVKVLKEGGNLVLRTPDRLPPVLSDAELARVLAQARRTREGDPRPCRRLQAHRDLVLLLTLVHTGLRIGEAVALSYRHEGEAHLAGVHKGRRTGQCDLSRPFALTPDRAGARLRRLMRAAGIDPGRSHPHIFRHTFAVRAVRVGMPSLMLARLLGHASPMTTMVYYHLLGTDVRPFLERMKLAAGAAGPAW